LQTRADRGDAQGDRLFAFADAMQWTHLRRRDRHARAEDGNDGNELAQAVQTEPPIQSKRGRRVAPERDDELTAPERDDELTF